METVKEKLVKLVHEGERYYADKCEEYGSCKGCHYDDPERLCGDVIVAEYLLQNGVTIAEPARPLEEWHEDYGDVLWWTFPITEPPYVGSPLCSDWPEYHTHWTPLPQYPQPPNGVQ